MPDKDLIVTISWLLNRQVSAQEAMDALGIARTTWYAQKKQGTLTCLDNLSVLADHFGLDKIDLFIRYGHITQQDLAAHVENAESDVLVVDPPRAPSTPPKRKHRRTFPAKVRHDAPPL